MPAPDPATKSKAAIFWVVVGAVIGLLVLTALTVFDVLVWPPG